MIEINTAKSDIITDKFLKIRIHDLYGLLIVMVSPTFDNFLHGIDSRSLA